MKSIPKLIRRFLMIMLLSSILFLVLNIGFLLSFTLQYMPNGRPWSTAQEAADSMEETEGIYAVSEEMEQKLQDSGIWAVYIDNRTGQALWHTDYLPEEIPLEYTFSQVSSLTRGYLSGYPTFTGEGENGLMILGYPKDSFWKHMYASWDMQMIKSMPRTVLIVLAGNIILVFIIYVGANSGLLRSVKPIAEGIQKLPTGEAVNLKETGILSELAADINQTSEMLQTQKYLLLKKDAARANWIAGVSHDIRTPLSMVMGYADQLSGSENLGKEERTKAGVIVRQSRRIKNLINDLNLASKLEYNMQPLSVKEENAVALVRQVAVDFINTDIEGRYPIEWETPEELTFCAIRADRDLLKRAVSNLIQNSMNHNEEGCTIWISVVREGKNCEISVEDNGHGATDEELRKLSSAPHYMVCDNSVEEQRHGLGLQIVKQIARSHGGRTVIGHGTHGGFGVKMILPCAK